MAARKTKQASQRKSWVFTLNNFSGPELTMLKEKLTDLCTYAIIGKEVGESGTPHLQGAFTLKDYKRMTWLKNQLSSRAHWEPMMGTEADSQKYCSKEGDVVLQLGTPRESKTGNNCRDVINAIKKGDEMPDDLVGLYSTRKRAFTEIASDELARERKKARIEMYKTAKLKRWQHELKKQLEGEPDSRAIFWYYDNDGNKGKSWMAKYLDATSDCITLSNGKSVDLYHAYNGQNLVVFDLSRAQGEIFNYDAMEHIKNGHVFSGKYDSKTKCFDVPHVIVFANCEPDYTKFSADRLVVRYIDVNADVEFIDE